MAFSSVGECNALLTSCQFLEYFFTRSDAKFLASLGLNCIRIPVNHRHFIDNLNPSVIRPEGFRLVDRIVDACAAEGLYTIIDMHTFPGGQNQGWHSDSGIHKALFWDFMDLQDRMVNLWVEIAKHYRGNTWVSPSRTCLDSVGVSQMLKALRSLGTIP